MARADGQAPTGAQGELARFLVLAFGLSWPLFLTPLALAGAGSDVQQSIRAATYSLGMFGPGVAAIITTRWIARRELRTLNLGRLGPKRFYLWAWLLPIVLALAALLFTVLVGAGRLDPTFAVIREGLEGLPEQEIAPVGAIVAVQVLASMTLAPLINTLFAMGEELGWRGYLLPKLLPLGTWRAILLSGAIWGLWHAPAIVQGHNYPGQPVLGIFFMVILSVLMGAILSWLYLETRSPWAPALAHGALNAVGGLPLVFLEPGLDIVWGGTLAAPVGWIGMAAFIAWLVYTRRLPRTLAE